MFFIVPVLPGRLNHSLEQISEDFFHFMNKLMIIVYFINFFLSKRISKGERLRLRRPIAKTLISIYVPTAYQVPGPDHHCYGHPSNHHHQGALRAFETPKFLAKIFEKTFNIILTRKLTFLRKFLVCEGFLFVWGQYWEFVQLILKSYFAHDPTLKDKKIIDIFKNKVRKA